MEPVVRGRHVAWVGWDGTAGRAPRPFRIDGLSLRPVSLSRAEVGSYYRGFCNSTLWPLYHDAIQTPEFHRDWWRPYLAVNRRFAAAAARASRPGGLVWFHDYHLQVAPMMLRARRPDLRIGLYMHIPFPPEELFAWLPWRSSILRGMLGADLIGFQTEAGAVNFSRLARRYTSAEGTDHELRFEKRRIACRSLPISIDAESIEGTARLPSVEVRMRQLRADLGDRRVLLAVDRLDYTKGIAARLLAFEELLQSRRLSASDVVLVQIAVPSREDALGYEEVRRETERIVGRINGQFSEPGKVAVHYFRRSLDREELVAWYRTADVMLVTPLRDGMNLVAKEYCASRIDHTGVLVLSEFAGAARELRRALIINPYDIESLKQACVAALRMPEREERMRMAILRTQVRRHDVFFWAESFMEAMQ